METPLHYERSRAQLLADGRARLEQEGEHQQGYAVGIVPSLRGRTFRDGGLALTWDRRLELSLARGEMEHRELVLVALSAQYQSSCHEPPSDPANEVTSSGSSG